jgi:hypothetical protein
MPPSPPQSPKTKITVTTTDESQNKPSSSSDSKQQGTTNHRAAISARIDSAVKMYPKEGAGSADTNDNSNNRSADLIQLQKEFQEFRKNLKELVIAAKQYPETLASASKARLDLMDKLKQLAIQSPVENKVVGGNGKESSSSTVASIMQKVSQHVKTHNQHYQKQILQYVVDWESTVTTRIDALTEEYRKVHTRLDHYRTKVSNLRKNTNKKMEAAAAKAAQNPPSSPTTTTTTTMGVPVRLQEKLQRNEGKLDQSWKIHQRCTANLCHVLEETTRQGWQDLVPLLLEYLQWEMDRTARLSDTMIAMAVISQELRQTLESERTKRLEYFEKIRGDSSVITTVASNKSPSDNNADDSGNASVLSDEEDDSSEGTESV